MSPIFSPSHCERTTEPNFIDLQSTDNLIAVMFSLSDTSLKSAQISSIHRMLAFNEESADASNEYNLPPSGGSHNQWKILIYDTACRSIISPILSVQQLRRRGVTLHLLLNTEREAIPDVPAIYFCRPTAENLAIIAQDCAKGLYARAHLNFATKLDRSLMEDFAKLVVQSGSLETIASVHDQYLDFTCLEKRLFSLHKQNSYVMYNGSGATEQMMEQTMTDIAYGLFSVVATMGQIPVIRCPKVSVLQSVPRLNGLDAYFTCCRFVRAARRRWSLENCAVW
jgi:sec1 family domain-containing protein 1